MCSARATLAEFALALLIGMLTGAYSSIFVAAPLLAVLKRSDKSWGGRKIRRAVGEALRDMVIGGVIGSRRTRAVAAEQLETVGKAVVPGSGSVATDGAAQARAALSHPPRPRKKKRR